MATDALGATTAIQIPVDVRGMDLETAMMAVQSNRANLLEAQLKDQIAAVQKKNDTIAQLNQVLGAFNAVAAKAPGDAKADTKISGWEKDDKGFWDAANLAKSSGLTLPDLTNKGQLDGFIQTLKSQIDSMSNSQQMDMLRLQSLSNKRNEAFEIMTNFVKKMADNRSSIVGNMR